MTSTTAPSPAFIERVPENLSFTLPEDTEIYLKMLRYLGEEGFEPPKMHATRFVPSLLLVAYRYIGCRRRSPCVLAAAKPWPFPAWRARRLKRSERYLVIPGEFDPLAEETA